MAYNKIMKKGQKGAAAIEFALVFIPLFAIFYATVTYGFSFLLLNAFTAAAEEGARHAIRVDGGEDEATDISDIDDAVERLILGDGNTDSKLAWLPAGIKDKVNVDTTAMSDGRVKVRVVYSCYRDSPPLPVLVLPVIGQVPRLPEHLAGEATISLNRPLSGNSGTGGSTECGAAT